MLLVCSTCSTYSKNINPNTQHNPIADTSNVLLIKAKRERGEYYGHMRVSLHHYFIKKTVLTKSKLPVVQICDVGHLRPEFFQQVPGRAVWQRFGALRREDESNGEVVSKAHIAVWTVCHVLHQPLYIYHGKVMHMESST